MCIVTGSTKNPNGNSDMSFFLDDEAVGSFASAPDGDKSYQFNVPVYANESLSSGMHNITIVSGLSGTQSLTLLDRIIYT